MTLEGSGTADCQEFLASPDPHLDVHTNRAGDTDQVRPNVTPRFLRHVAQAGASKDVGRYWWAEQPAGMEAGGAAPPATRRAGQAQFHEPLDHVRSSGKGTYLASMITMPRFIGDLLASRARGSQNEKSAQENLVAPGTLKV